MPALEVARPEFDPPRNDLLQFDSGVKDAQGTVDMGEIGVQLDQTLVKLVDLAGKLGALVAQPGNRKAGHSAASFCRWRCQ